MYRLELRIDEDAVVDIEEMFDWFKKNADKWFYGYHAKEGNPHYHWYLETKYSDNRVRQKVREYLVKKGNGAYKCKNVTEEGKIDVDRYASYCCFKSHTTKYEYGGFTVDDEVRWRDSSKEVLIAVMRREKQKSSVDYITRIIDDIGYYRWDMSHIENCDRFMFALRKMRCLNTYVRGKMEALFHAWKDGSVDNVIFEDDEEGKKSYDVVMQRINEYKEKVYRRLWDGI